MRLQIELIGLFHDESYKLKTEMGYSDREDLNCEKEFIYTIVNLFLQQPRQWPGGQAVCRVAKRLSSAGEGY